MHIHLSISFLQRNLAKSLRERARKRIDIRRNAHHVKSLLKPALCLFSGETKYAGDLARALGRGEDLGDGGFVLGAAVRDTHGYSEVVRADLFRVSERE